MIYNTNITIAEIQEKNILESKYTIRPDGTNLAYDVTFSVLDFDNLNILLIPIFRYGDRVYFLRENSYTFVDNKDFALRINNKTNTVIINVPNI